MTMTDQLRQALEHDEMRVRKGLVSSDPLLVAAARAYADLLENGLCIETPWPEWATRQLPVKDLERLWAAQRIEGESP